jgi:hypothetical protein
VQQQLAAAMRALFTEMTPLVSRLAEYNAELHALLSRASPTGPPLRLPLPVTAELFRMWSGEGSARGGE